jgi:hypothetical protein
LSLPLDALQVGSEPLLAFLRELPLALAEPLNGFTQPVELNPWLLLLRLLLRRGLRLLGRN